MSELEVTMLTVGQVGENCFIARAHHGSLSHEERTLVEEMFSRVKHGLRRAEARTKAGLDDAGRDHPGRRDRQKRQKRQSHGRISSSAR